jgi:hypothetical protein
MNLDDLNIPLCEHAFQLELPVVWTSSSPEYDRPVSVLDVYGLALAEPAAALNIMAKRKRWRGDLLATLAAMPDFELRLCYSALAEIDECFADEHTNTSTDVVEFHRQLYKQLYLKAVDAMRASPNEIGKLRAAASYFPYLGIAVSVLDNTVELRRRLAAGAHPKLAFRGSFRIDFDSFLEQAYDKLALSPLSDSVTGVMQVFVDLVGAPQLEGRNAYPGGWEAHL